MTFLFLGDVRVTVKRTEDHDSWLCDHYQVKMDSDIESSVPVILFTLPPTVTANCPFRFCCHSPFCPLKPDVQNANI